jgi:hypothetical protein
MPDRLDTTYRLSHRLRDLQVPDGVADWPPAPGWWIVAILTLALLVPLVRFLHRRAGPKRAAIRELDRLHADFRENRDLTALAAGLSVLLKRVALARHPRAEVAGLTGKAWSDFLGPGLADLADLPYRPPLPVPGDLARGRELIGRARAWIGRRA